MTIHIQVSERIAASIKMFKIWPSEFREKFLFCNLRGLKSLTLPITALPHANADIDGIWNFIDAVSFSLLRNCCAAVYGHT